MPELIREPSRVAAAGEPPKLIDEYVGRVSTGQAGLSIAHMRSPSGWAEPGQRPEFDEFTIVLRGALVVESDDGQLMVQAGQAVHARPGEWVRYSTPGADGAEYVSVCVPAFTPGAVHRDDLSTPQPGSFRRRQRRPATWQDCVPPRFIHISTAPVVHSLAGSDQQVCPNYPQCCAQGVILAGQGLQVGMSQGRKPLISRHPARRAGTDRPARRLLAEGVPAGCSRHPAGTLHRTQLQEDPDMSSMAVDGLATSAETRPERLPASPRLALAEPPAPTQRDPLRPLEVAQCTLCGIARPLGLLVPDGGRACADIRWYCKDAKSCTERWTAARPPGSAHTPPVPGTVMAAAGETST